MEFVGKFFEELTASQVYEILKSRSKIFMLEQDIRCLDMDDMDYQSRHCFLEDKGRVVAYLRAFYTDEHKCTVKIGRVLTLHHGKGIGRSLMEKAICDLQKAMQCKKLCVDSQKHAMGYYEKFGFIPVSSEFLEEGIPHVAMEKIL